MKKVHLCSNTCIRCQLNLNLIKKFLIKNNFSLTLKIEDADLIIFSACGYIKNAENHSIRIIKEINKKKKPESELVVCGCFPKTNKERLQPVFNGVSFGPLEMYKMNEIINAKTKIEHIEVNNKVPKFHFRGRTFLGKILELIHANLFSINIYNEYCIKISTGCLGNCSYCVEKRAWGNVKSKSIETIIDEFREGLRGGYKQIFLTSSDCGCYGLDIGTDLVELLEEMIKEKGDYKIAIGFINPVWLIKMFQRLKEIFRSGRINYITSSVQSGSNKILKLMNRGHRVEDFRRCIKCLNKEFPSIILATDIIIGFPGETEEDFEKTLRLINDELDFNYVTHTICCEMPGTKSFKLPNKVSYSIKRHRSKKFILSRILKKIRFILNINHPHAWLKYSFRYKY